MKTKKSKGAAASAHGHESASKSTPGARKQRPHAIIFDPKEKVTKPSFAQECDINRIVNRFTETGMVTHLARGTPEYGDAPDQNLFEAACVSAELKSQIEEGNDLAQVEYDALNPSEELSEEIPPVSAETEENPSETAPTDDESSAE